MKTPRQLKTKLIVILGVLGVSFSAIFVRFCEAPSMVLVFYRLGFSAVLSTILGMRELRSELPQLDRANLARCLVSGTFLAFHFYAFFTAVKTTSIAAAAALVDVEVFFVAAALILLFREKLPGAVWMGILITFLGSMLITLSDGMGGGSISGDLWALSGAFFMAVYTLTGRACRRSMSTLSYTAIVYWITTLVSLLLLCIRRTPIFGYAGQDILCALGMAVFCTLLGHSIFSWALKTVNPAFVATAKLLEPVFSTILGIFIFTEIPGLLTVCGGIVVIFGVILTGKFME